MIEQIFTEKKMQNYTTNPERFQEIKKTILLGIARPLLIVSALSLGISNYSAVGIPNRISIILFLSQIVVFSFIIWNILRISKSAFYSYYLTVSGNEIIREQHKEKKLTIAFENISEIMIQVLGPL